MFKKSKTTWYPLDNAGKIYPPTANESRPHVFSFSAMLNQPVEPEVLKRAVENVLKNNPTFNTKLMRGKFWYYLEENNAPVKIFTERPYYLRSIDYKANNNYLFKVSYLGNRLTINFFHCLTDGTGGFSFFSQVLLEYFTLMNFQIDSEDKIRSIDKPFFNDEGDDCFLLYNKKADAPTEKLKKPFKIIGTPFNYDGCGMITAQVPINELKKLAKTHNATITAFLGGLYIWTIYTTYLKNKPIKNKHVCLLVPCNLRKKYGGSTMRNFTMFARVNQNFDEGEFSLDNCIEIAQKQISEQLTTENLDKIIYSNVKTEKNPLIKIVPLAIKDIILRMAYVGVGENLQTGILSNLGLVNLPESFKDYVKHLTFSIAPTFSCKQQMTAIGYRDNLYITFTRSYVENIIEKDFIRNLSSSGLSVKVFSNYWESEP